MVGQAREATAGPPNLRLRNTASSISRRTLWLRPDSRWAGHHVRRFLLLRWNLDNLLADGNSGYAQAHTALPARRPETERSRTGHRERAPAPAPRLSARRPIRRLLDNVTPPPDD